MKQIMVDTNAVIDSLMKVYDERKLSVDTAYDIVYENDPVNCPSRSSISRVFSKNVKTEDKKVRWEATLRPIANALLDFENIETDDEPDEQAFKSILKLKKDTIEELREKLKNAEIDYHKRLASKTADFQKSIDFAKHQIELKDKRIDQLMHDNHLLLEQLLSCNKCKKGE